MTGFNTNEALYSAAIASARGDKGQYFCFIKKRIWYFLRLLSAQPGPRSGKKWATLPDNHFHNNFLNCAVKKMNPTVPLHVSSSINRK
jgi:hypothetical protein